MPNFVDEARAMGGGFDGVPSGFATHEILGVTYAIKITGCRKMENKKFGTDKVDPDKPEMFVVEGDLLQPVINPSTGELVSGTIKIDGQVYAYPFNTGSRVTITYKPGSQPISQFVKALVDNNAIEPLPGGIWVDTFTETKDTGKGNPAKHRSVQYTPPAPVVPANNFVGAAAATISQPTYQAPAQPVFQPQQQAPFQPAPAPAFAPQQPVYAQPEQQVYAPAAAAPQPAQFQQPTFPQAVDPGGNGHNQGFAQAPQPFQPQAPAPSPFGQPIAQPSVATAAPPQFGVQAPPQGFGPQAS